jgi:hypothetical protein
MYEAHLKVSFTVVNTHKKQSELMIHYRLYRQPTGIEIKRSDERLAGRIDKAVSA